MEAPGDGRRELGAFLRARRERLVRGDYPVPALRRSRATGLRREEIAYLAGVSVTWYTWLEQGRDINASRQVLDAVAASMRLSGAEHEYILSLAGFATLGSSGAPLPDPVPEHLQRLLDAQLPAPAFAISPDWSISGWNRAYEVLYPTISQLPLRDRNLLALIFTDPYVRQMLPDWDVTSRRFLAEYRAEAGALVGQPAHAALIGRLQQQSPDFARAWAQHEVGRFETRERRFLHPEAGELVFEYHRLTPSDVPDSRVVIYLPSPDSRTHEQMHVLLAERG